jgi:hypothetical protein
VVESIVTDLDGKLIGGRDVEIKAVQKDWKFDKGSWSEVVVDEQTCSVKSPQSSPPAGVVERGVSLSRSKAADTRSQQR